MSPSRPGPKPTPRTPDPLRPYSTAADRERMVAEYLPLVHRIARSLARRSTDPVEDLVQVGAIGLLEAIDRYQTDRNTGFKTYAVHLITGSIRHYLRDRQSLMRGPRVLQDLSYRLGQITEKLLHDLGREPNHVELAQALGIPLEQVDEARQYERSVSVLWLDQEGDESDFDKPRTLLENLMDPTYANKDYLDDHLIIREAMDQLPDDLRELLELRYFEDLTQVELSRRLNLSQMEVSRRLRKGEQLLRKHFQTT